MRSVRVTRSETINKSGKASLEAKARQLIKQKKAKFIVVSTYPIWLSNVVPVPKKDGRVRVGLPRPKSGQSQRRFPLATHRHSTTSRAMNCSPSWMDSWDTTKFLLMKKIGKRQRSLHHGVPSAIESCPLDSRMLGQPTKGP